MDAHVFSSEHDFNSLRNHVAINLGHCVDGCGSSKNTANLVGSAI